MSNEIEYEVVLAHPSDTSEVPKGADLSYRCLRCGDVMPSIPDDNIACKCDNICIDIDIWRLDIDEHAKMEVVRRR